MAYVHRYWVKVEEEGAKRFLPLPPERLRLARVFNRSGSAWVCVDVLGTHYLDEDYIQNMLAVDGVSLVVGFLEETVSSTVNCIILSKSSAKLGLFVSENHHDVRGRAEAVLGFDPWLTPQGEYKEYKDWWKLGGGFCVSICFALFIVVFRLFPESAGAVTSVFLACWYSGSLCLIRQSLLVRLGGSFIIAVALALLAFSVS